MKADAQLQPALWAVASRLTLESLESGRAVLLAPPTLVAMALKVAAPKLTELFTKHSGGSISVVIRPGATDREEPRADTRAPVADAPGPGAEPAKTEPEGFAPGDHPADHPLVKRVQQVLGARVTRVMKRPTPGGSS